VLLLLAAVTLLGLGDLYATLLHLGSVGMAELNPIAAYLISAGSVPGLVLFKLGCMALTVGLIWKLRHHLVAELGTWLLFAMMAMLTVHWYQYNGLIQETLETRRPYVQQSYTIPDWHFTHTP
jgi:hypothetical protein